MSKKSTYFSCLFYNYMVFGSVAIIFKCAFLSGIECSLLRKNISNFAEATREKRFTTMTPLGMSRDVMCHRLWRHKCFSNSIQFEHIYILFQYEHHKIYLKFVLFSVSEKETNFSITPRTKERLRTRREFPLE